MSEQPTAKKNASEIVLQMRDEFLQLVSAYNAVGEYDNAMDAQVIAIALTKFEDDHMLTYIEWPARVETNEDGAVDIAEIERIDRAKERR